MTLCLCCGKEGKHNILLVRGDHGNGRKDPRWYIPNQFARNNRPEILEEVWFCGSCMRAIEDNVRATILYLQSENKGWAP